MSNKALLSEVWRNHVANLQHLTPVANNPFEPFNDEIQSIQERFALQVQRYPDRLAVKTQHYAWTYQELNDKANQVAHALLKQCHVDENQVALLFEHDAQMLAGIMGALKAGKTYVPLTPDFPRKRLEYIVQDSQVSVILTDEQNLNLAQTLTHKTIQLINIDQLETAKHDIHLTVSPDTIAYLLYTSGSTGEPKGVIQNHRNVLHFIRTYTNNLHITADDKLTLLSYYSFDAAVVDIFAALLNGATLYPINLKEDNFTDLSAWLIQQQITIYHSTPTVYRHWLNTLTCKENFSPIRLIVLGGEPVYQNDVDGYKKHFSSECLFVNGLGSTESSFSLQYLLNKQTPITRHEVPVGYPLENTEILLLDEAGVDTDIYGEIAIRSPYLALGYWQQPQLTQAVFLPDPEGGNLRIYRTGDIGRLLPDGSLEFVGRKDFQVKLRGFRIELGEIEAALCQYEAVKEAVVTLYEADDNKRLAAYLTIADESNIELTELKDRLRARLPDYMIPASFTVLERLPLTPNGKIDRKALPVPLIESASSGKPITPVEELLADLWADLLKRETVSRDDNFFELGGHSLLATQLTSRIRDAFQVELPVRAVFEHPQLSGLAAEIEAAGRKDGLPPIIRQPADSDQVLSFAQQRLWFLDQFEESHSATYNMPVALRLEGDLNKEALQASLHWLSQRHESLRTIFPARNGQASVRIIDPENFKILTVHDLTELSDEAQAAEVQKRADRHAVEPFDLATGPLFRADLLFIDKQRSVLLLNMHHIISDGWSMGVFIRDWQHAWTTFAQGEKPSLPSLPIQYSDYAVWQRDRLQGEILQRQLDYWREQLNGAPELLELPTDKPRPPQQSYQGAHYTRNLSPDLSQKTLNLSRERGVSLFMTLLTAFNILLSRYAGQDDICVGSPIANRTHSQTEDIIGFFVNTLVLRSRIQSEYSFIKLLRETRKTCLDAYAHQDIPFDMLVEELRPARSLSHSPLFQVMLVLQNNDPAELTLPGLEITPLETDYPIAKFDLTLNVEEWDGQLHCLWEYATDLFHAETVERMAAHFEILLTALIENPEQPISQASMLTEKETAQLLAWNDTAVDYPKDQTVVDLFEQQVEKTPDNIAVVFEEEQLTYRQLNEKANQLAHHLLMIRDSAGIRSDNTLTAIAVERSPEMVIGLLGILKAGCAYVPIDPDYPAARIRYMLEDSAAPLLLTQSHLKTLLPLEKLEHECVTVCLDEADFTSLPTDNPDVKRKPTDLAYVIYTSGSTGRPKGVMNAHTGIVNRLLWMQETYQLSAVDRILQKTPFSFDVSVWEFFWPLLSGAGLVVAKPEGHKDPAYLASVIAENAVTVLHFVPSMLHAFLSHMDITVYDSLKHVICSGEALTAELINKFYARFGDFNTELHNLYGPTEAAVDVSFWPCQTKKQHACVPIGKPVANTRLYVVDAKHQPIPVGVPGELLIAGIQVARGYLNRPELTAEKFIEIEIFGRTERVYKTGDLARWLPDGNLEYLGRMDHQVKLRGFRIELGEIEAVLCQHEAVKEAVVTLYEADDNKRLAAYLTVADKSDIELTELKDRLKTRLPDYMIPASFTVLERLPLTPNGKIDRKALPAPLIESASSGKPVTPVEELLAGLWADLLKRETVSRDDNFFELGGHSLLATQLISRIRDAFQVELPVRAVFEHPQLSGLAAEIEATGREDCLSSITRQSADSDRVMSFAQQRLWFLDQFEESHSATYNMPVALRLEGDLNRKALQSSLHWLSQRHESLRTVFPARNGQASMRIIDPEDFEILTIHDLSGLSGEALAAEVRNRADRHAVEPFDLATGPLFKADLLLLDKQQSVLLLNMHHIISDGWSMGVFIRDWQHAWTAFTQGEEPSLPPLPIQYSDYAVWQRDRLQGEVVQRQADYWRGQLSGVPGLLELPTDKPRPPQQSYQGAQYAQNLSSDLSRKTLDLSRKQGVSLFMTLLTAFDILLSRYAGQDDICVGSPIANRTHSQAEDIIGLFVNTLVLRTQIRPQCSFTELLPKTRKICLDAYAHQDIPFEMLVEELRPARSLSHSPLFQVMLVLQNNDPVELTLPGLEITAFETDYPVAKFDLTLNVEERDGQLHCLWEYATDLFHAETIERMAAHFEILLTALIENPEQPVGQVSMLTEKETGQLLTWNDTAVDYPKDQTVVDLFEQQVEKTPDNIAVVFEEEQLTYRQLNEKANQLAHHLLMIRDSAGIRSDNTLTAIAVERSPEMVIGLLGILKAGCAYVPIDPDYPADRIRYMLEDSAAPLLLTQSHLKKQLPLEKLEHECVMVCLDEAEFTSLPTDNSVVKRKPTNLAYVIYTSGSTGRPKGVMVEHKGLVNLASAQISIFRILPESRVLQFASFSFDASISEITTAFLTGAALYLAPKATLLDSADLTALLVQQQISHITLPPSFLSSLPEAAFSGLKTLAVAGEACLLELIKKWTDRVHFINAYGPTESTVCASMAVCCSEMGTPHIGHPIANTRIYILDAQHRPLPSGIPGELCIAGAGLARGYLNRPELTAEKFIGVEIFGKTERVYKTGDLARWLPDGNLEYLGRMDHQVKLRGFRIELGEIETVLCQHEAVKESVVTLYEADDNKRLAAYLAVADESDIDQAELKNRLRARLPDYMIPASFTVLERLPLTPNGKVDRKALPAPDANMPTENTLPRDAVELRLLSVWETVLDVNPLGIDDNFFELGGHSLLAVKLMSHIQQQFGIRLSVSMLFQNPTVAALAQHLRRDTPKPQLTDIVPIQTTGETIPVYGLPGAVGSVMYLYPLASYLGRQQPFYALQTPGLDGRTTPETVEALAESHLQALRQQQPSGPYQLLGHSSGGRVAFEMAWQLEQQGETVALLAMLDTDAPDSDQPDPTADYTEMNWLSDIVSMFEELSDVDLNLSSKQLHAVSDKETAYAEVMRAFIERDILFAPGTPLDELKALVNTYRITVQEHAGYQIPGRLRCPIHLFRAQERMPELQPDVEQPPEDARPFWGWGERTSASVTETYVPGTHVTMMTSPHVQALAAAIKPFFQINQQ